MPSRPPPVFDADALWSLARVGEPSLSPDGGQAVVCVSQPSMEENRSRSSLYLLSTLGGRPRRLTEAGDKDHTPRWSPRGDQIAFIAKRHSDGKADAEPQLYLIAPDGGEARRAAELPTGIESFKWFPDGRHIAFAAWVWPELKHAAQGPRMQVERERKDSAYVTDDTLYRWWDHNLPQGRALHLHVLDTATGRVRDLFEGTTLELGRMDHSADAYDIAPDGRRLVFAFDPAAEPACENRFALAEIEVRSRQHRVLLQDNDWHFDAPRYSHSGRYLAFLASPQGLRHTAPNQLGVLDVHGHWAICGAAWDRDIAAPLHWAPEDDAIVFAAEDQGRRHLWQMQLPSGEVDCLCRGGHVGAFDLQAQTCVVQHDSLHHPPRLSVLTDEGPRRIEHFNDALLARHRFGEAKEHWMEGALGDPVQTWLVFPPGFDPRRKYPVLHLIHGGPHTCFGDSWHWRWNHQAFAAQGYVVACVNYHGSSSFGHAFLDSITHRWAELELQDIEATTTWLLQQRWVDGARISAAGGSYGGYMVAWMNAHVSPGRYQAYICHAGAFDWQAMYADDAYGWHHQELGARYFDDPAQVARQNPAAHIAGARTPTLVSHGAQDYRVPDAQGLAYYNTLKSLGVPARLVWFPDENHWILKPRNSRLWYREVFDWLALHAPKARSR